VHEAPKPVGAETFYCLGITATIDGNHRIETEIQRVNEELVGWLLHRRHAASDVVLCYQASLKCHAGILDYTVHVLSQQRLQPALCSLSGITVKLADPDSGRVWDYRFRVKSCN
jgi:hypothetical protein